MKTKRLAMALVLVAGTVVFAACGSDNEDNSGGGAGKLLHKLVKSEKTRVVNPAVPDAEMAAFVIGQYDLNFDIIRKNSEIAKKNAMISTYSIQTALAMAWAGAAGTTASEMQKALNFGDHAHEALNKIDTLIMSKNTEAIKSEYEEMDPIEIRTANDLYLSPNYTWASAWLDTLAAHYDAGITEMNFAADPEGARKYINDAVSEATHERIKDLIPEGSITTNTELVLTNAIYFKAPWRSDVTKSSEPLIFNRADGSSVDAEMLMVSDRLGYAKGDNYQAVSVDLRNDAFEVMFVLPDKGKFDDVLGALNGKMVDDIFAVMDYNRQVLLSFPAYEFTTSLKLNGTLNQLGMKQAFGGADFSKMTVEPNDMYISDIFHKSYIGVDDKGVEAAAATALIAQSEGVEINEVILALDRPFVFMIYESDTHTPLFVGQVFDPTAHN
ncbi:MAG: hypothetical protein J6A01_04790 [Proteobacteria bacterium]|nr:hypothetical protein [Pseudomonadota bacterium]